MVVVSHLFFFLWKKVRARCGSYEPSLALFRAVYFPTDQTENPEREDCERLKPD